MKKIIAFACFALLIAAGCDLTKSTEGVVSGDGVTTDTPATVSTPATNQDVCKAQADLLCTVLNTQCQPAKYESNSQCYTNFWASSTGLDDDCTSVSTTALGAAQKTAWANCAAAMAALTCAQASTGFNPDNPNGCKDSYAPKP
jgi:hypothetical protein